MINYVYTYYYIFPRNYSGFVARPTVAGFCPSTWGAHTMVWNRQGASDDLGECLNDIIVSAHENPSSCLTRTIYWECVEVYMSSVPYNHPYINVILSSWKLAYVKYWRWTVGLHLVWVFSVLHKYPWWWVKHQGRVSFDHKAWGVWAEPKWWFHGIISTNSSNSCITNLEGQVATDEVMFWIFLGVLLYQTYDCAEKNTEHKQMLAEEPGSGVASHPRRKRVSYMPVVTTLT